MRIKKLNNNKFILSKDNVWVRDFCCSLKPVDINKFCYKENKLWINNEFQNIKKLKLELPVEELKYENIVICSDGFGWSKKHKILGKLPNFVKIIGTNNSLSRWEMVGEKAEIKKSMSFYLANNPYPECMSYLPKNHNYYPNLISSTRTYPEFINKYRSQPYFYKPAEDLNYSGGFGSTGLVLDDYRNPICAAISLSWFLGVKKLLLFCCDESFSENRAGSLQMSNKLHQYPQQIMSQNIIDKQLYWMKQQGVEIFDHSSGINYENAEYIDEDDLLSFFQRSAKNE